MKFNNNIDHRSTSMKIFLLVIVFVILLLNLFIFKNSASDSPIKSFIDPLFGNHSVIFYFYFSNILAWTFLIFSFALILFENQSKDYSQVPIFLLFTSIVLSSAFISSKSELVFGIWFSSTFLFSVYHFQYYFPGLKNTRARLNIQMSIYLLSIIILVGFLVIRFLSMITIIFDSSGWISGWSGLFLVISVLFCFLYLKNHKNQKNLDLKFVYAFASIVALPPLGISLFFSIKNSNLPINPWILFPLSLIPIFLGIFLTERINGQEESSDTKILRNIKTFLIIIAGVGILITLSNLFNGFINFFQVSTFIGFHLFLSPIVLILVINQSKIPFFKHKKGVDFKENQLSIVRSDYFETIEEAYVELRSIINELVPIERYIQFILDPTTNEYYSFPFQNLKTSDLKFTANSAIVRLLSTTKNPFVFEDLNNLPMAIRNEKEILKLLDVQAFIPMMTKEYLHGWLALSFGQKKGKDIRDDIERISPSISKTTKQIERLIHQLELEKRVKNMSVLTRIVQGVNYTVALDDIYELIYAQTTQIIPADDFYIILKDQNSQRLRLVFCVEFDERISAKENQMITKIKTIESEIVESGRGLLLRNYIDYCQKRDLAVLYDDIQTAIIVPLNTGAITNGCILVAHRGPEKSFTEDQLNFVQSVADLVAGAIEKARLLQETDRYAHQLSILNDLTRNLTSTFDFDELYETILKNSVDMIDCEEARLIIVDENTQELVYKKVTGEQSEELFERRFPLDYGLAGQAYQSQNQVIIDQSHIQNEILQENVFKKERPINSLMIIPMVLKNQVLGLIELINRRGEGFFNKNDQGLLSAFAAQSAIALENARLYYRTDQALAKRVEELSVMQLIDRELNTSLDIKRAMEITLSWAIRQLDGNAGWIGQVIENKIQLMASQGYDTEILARISDETRLFTQFEQEEFLNNAQPLQIFTNQENRLHPLGKTQILVPIQREGKTIALMMLEMLEEKPVDENDLNFLMRLSDHASIALINSQLYSEVQAANQAKSEFVSLVAHELKNPMTSIKGYTELLVAGAAGVVNEAQTNFLTTIRSNTERMNTLVSDLNDLSKIEAGNMRLESKAIQLIDLINEIIRSTKRQIDEKQQKINVNISDDFPEIWGDSNRLLQILTNLVSNAHKYSQINGEISISAEVTENLWVKEGEAKVAHIWVQDNGVGISEEDQQMIFQKFFRSENPKIRESSGTGLGLNITQSLVKMQGGRIWFESDLQKGTTFHFTVPLAKEENNP